jgi:hypothetical protein
MESKEERERERRILVRNQPEPNSQSDYGEEEAHCMHT